MGRGDREGVFLGEGEQISILTLNYSAYKPLLENRPLTTSGSNERLGHSPLAQICVAGDNQRFRQLSLVGLHKD